MRAGPFPDGWLPTGLLSGVAGQVALSVYSVSKASPGYRDIFFSDLLVVPQGFVTCLAVGLVFWVALHALGRERPAE